MAEGYYPRIETISVPPNIKPEYIGKYVTDAAAKVLESVGRSSINYKSISLRESFTTPLLFLLSFDTNNPYVISKDLQLFTPDSTEHRAVEQTRVALRTKGKPGENNPIQGQSK